MPSRKQVSKVVKLDSEIVERLEKLAVAVDRSAHWLMKDAISRYLEREEYVQMVNKETEARWQEALQGKVISHEAMSAWLDTWGTDMESDRPECES